MSRTVKQDPQHPRSTRRVSRGPGADVIRAMRGGWVLPESKYCTSRSRSGLRRFYKRRYGKRFRQTAASEVDAQVE